MAELVDALVSNTSGVKPLPVRSRLRVQERLCKLLIFKHHTKSFPFYPQIWSLFGQHFEVALIGDNLSFPELEESLLKRMKGGKPDFAHRLFLRKSPFPHIAKLVYL